MIKTLLGRLFLRRRTWTKVCTAMVATAITVLALGCAREAAAKGMTPTKTRPTRLRRSAAIQSEPPKSAAAKPGARKLASRRGSTSSVGAGSVGAGSTGAGARRSGVSQSTSKSGSAAAVGGTAPRKERHHAKPQADEDMPMMEQVRARRGRGHVVLRRAGLHGASLGSAVLRRNVAPREATSVGPSMSLRGTRDVLVHQNLMADDEGLERIQTDADLERLRSSSDLIDFADSRSLHVNPELPEDRRCARLWAVVFANDLSRDYYQRFGAPLELTSAARSVEYQRHLARFNGNAAGVDGETSSPHLTGQAIDLGKKGMTRAELAWMRARLLPLMQAGKIDVEEEFKQACFHISVYRTYLPPAHEVAATPALATGTTVQ